MAVMGRFVPAALVALAMAGCGPTRPAALDRARDDYARAITDPVLVDRAPGALEAARLAVDRAEREWAHEHDAEETRHLAYVARQRVEIARAEARADRATETAERLRDREVVLDSEGRRAETGADTDADVLADSYTTERGLEYTLDDRLFVAGGAALAPGAGARLEGLVRYLRRHPERDVLVEGYSDDADSAEANERLSRDRARAVEAYLLRAGVDPARLATRSYAERFPVASNETEGGRELNRRVEVVILRPGEVASEHMRR